MADNGNMSPAAVARKRDMEQKIVQLKTMRMGEWNEQEAEFRQMMADKRADFEHQFQMQGYASWDVVNFDGPHHVIIHNRAEFEEAMTIEWRNLGLMRRAVVNGLKWAEREFRATLAKFEEHVRQRGEEQVGVTLFYGFEMYSLAELLLKDIQDDDE